VGGQRVSHTHAACRRRPWPHRPLTPPPARPPAGADGNWTAALQRLGAELCRVESFYDSMGGIIGYQLKSLQLILGSNAEQQHQEAAPAATHAGSSTSTSQPQQQQRAEEVAYHVPPGLDLAGEAGRQIGALAAAQVRAPRRLLGTQKPRATWGLRHALLRCSSPQAAAAARPATARQPCSA